MFSLTRTSRRNVDFSLSRDFQGLDTQEQPPDLVVDAHKQPSDCQLSAWPRQPRLPLTKLRCLPSQQRFSNFLSIRTCCLKCWNVTFRLLFEITHTFHQCNRDHTSHNAAKPRTTRCVSSHGNCCCVGRLQAPD
jgi:hypothetical protein